MQFRKPLEDTSLYQLVSSFQDTYHCINLCIVFYCYCIVLYFMLGMAMFEAQHGCVLRALVETTSVE